MIQKIQFDKLWVHVIAILLFLGISLAYFPQMIEGKVLKQSDVINSKGMSKEVLDFKAKTGKEPLWTNSMFGGMPDYLISCSFKHNYIPYIRDAYGLELGRPASFVFLYLIGFYLMLLLFGVNPWLSIVGAIGFAFSSYFFIIIDAGHVTKALALSFMPPLIGGIYYAYKKNPIVGSLIVAFFFAFQLMTQHMQIIYYSFIAIVVLVAFLSLQTVLEKQFRRFILASICLGAAFVIAAGLNFSSLYFINEYGKESMRGKSELTLNQANKTSGLDKDYATAWSYGISESWTFLVPNFHGGGFADDYKYSDFYKTNFEQYKNYFVQQGYSLKAADDAARNNIAGQFYWGAQPFTSGPVYAGAVMFFLFVLGFFVVKGSIKWWLVIITILSFMLSWGKNLMWFTDLWMDYMPGYNKFRTVSMTLIIAEFAVPLLGILAVDKLFKKQVIESDCKSKLCKMLPKFPKISKDYIANIIFKALIITGGFLLFFLMFGSGLFDFQTAGDKQVTPEIISARQQIFSADVLRSLLYVILAAGVLLLWCTNLIWKKTNKNTALFIVILGALVVLDMWTVDKRYLNDNDFVSKYEMETPFTQTAADTFILTNNPDKARVLNLSVSTFNDASTSYFHQSIGGYHGAKMKRYQELIDYHIMPEMQAIMEVLKNKPTQSKIDSALATSGVLNMLNTKFIIYNGEAAPIVNYHCNGTAWFIKNVQIVANADKEIESLRAINTKTTIVVDKRFEKDASGTISLDSSAQIKRTSYNPNDLVYESNSSKDGVVVFSEIYYAKGWNAYVDGKLTPYFRANYILRAMKIPAGHHTIEFKFEPRMYEIGGMITLICFIVLIGFTIVYIVYQRIRKENVVV